MELLCFWFLNIPRRSADRRCTTLDWSRSNHESYQSQDFAPSSRVISLKKNEDIGTTIVCELSCDVVGIVEWQLMAVQLGVQAEVIAMYNDSHARPLVGLSAVIQRGPDIRSRKEADRCQRSIGASAQSPSLELSSRRFTEIIKAENKIDLDSHAMCVIE